MEGRPFLHTWHLALKWSMVLGTRSVVCLMPVRIGLKDFEYAWRPCIDAARIDVARIEAVWHAVHEATSDLLHDGTYT